MKYLLYALVGTFVISLLAGCSSITRVSTYSPYFAPVCVVEKAVIEALPETNPMDELSLLLKEEAHRLEEEKARQQQLAEERRILEEQLEASKQERLRMQFLDEHIFFDYNSTELTTRAKVIISKKAQWINEHPDKNIAIIAYCDERGSVAYNLKLARKRALAVIDHLKTFGIDQVLELDIKGETKIFGIRSNEDDWAKNRRVQLVIR